MLKIIFIAVISTFCTNMADAQKSFNINIKLDSNINL
ncbi:MAG: hypothetical protein JWR50_694 [Mucilaginibacter sp.]|nr:hypothetical protein [Mucilaginibacter sp.]